MTARGSDSDGGNTFKGSVFALIVEDLLRLVSARKVARDELADRLEPSDVEFLDRPVWPTEWCDIRAYARFMELLVWRLRAAEAMSTCGNPAPPGRLAKAMDSNQRFLAFGRDLKRLTTLSASVYNFSHWEPKPASGRNDRYMIEIADASPFPEVFCWTTEGFINPMAAQHGAPDLWRWERARPDQIVFHMTRSL